MRIVSTDEVGRLRAENDALRAAAVEIARWIVEQFDYPIENAARRPPSEVWRRLIEDAWVERDGDPSNSEINESIRVYVGVDGGWVK